MGIHQTEMFKNIPIPEVDITTAEQLMHLFHCQTLSEKAGEEVARHNSIIFARKCAKVLFNQACELYAKEEIYKWGGILKKLRKIKV